MAPPREAEDDGISRLCKPTRNRDKTKPPNSFITGPTTLKKFHAKSLPRAVSADDLGLSSGKKSKVRKHQALSALTLVEVTNIDGEGDMFGIPLDWNEGAKGPAPGIQLNASENHAPAVGDRVMAKLIANPAGSDHAYRGKVVRVLSSDIAKVVGIFKKSSGGGGRIMPSGKKDRDEYMVPKGDEGNAKDGELVVAEVMRQRGRGLLQVRVRQRLGDAADPRHISLIAIHTHGIADEFSAAVEAEVQGLKSFRQAGRTDLRDIPFITIDPADARDHDDAIWAEPDTDAKNMGGHKLIIAIADVAAYVLPGSALDKEARKRGNSMYFPDRVVPMLPERISNDLCSLTEGDDRPVLACFITIDNSGAKTSHHFKRAVMRVAAGLAYEEAQAAIDGKPGAHAKAVLKSTLLPLWSAYACLCKARDKRGPLDLDLPERKILLDDKGNIDRVIVPDRLDAHRLVEEFMIQANVAAAEQLIKKRTPLLFRVHEQPSLEKLRALAEFLRTVNIPFALGQVIRSSHFNKILNAAKATPQQRLINEVVLRSQSQANYRALNAGHFGLSLANYAHFTSPIRRYADLIVHRALIKALGFGEDGLSAFDIAHLDETAEMISAAERRAMLAERETMDRLVASHLAAQIGATFKGRVSGVVGAGLFVVLKETGADGFVPASSLGRDFYALDPTRHALVGASSGETFQLGDDVEVRLMEVAPLKGGLRLEIVGEGKSGEKPKRSRRPQVLKSKFKKR